MSASSIDTSAARSEILNRIMLSAHESPELPVIPDYAPQGDATENFIRHLEGCDGKVMSFTSRDEALAWLHNNIDRSKLKVYSAINGFTGNVTPDDVTDPHAAHIVQACIGQGLIGVGETGSVWVTETSLGLTACALFATDLYLMLDAATIVPGIHQAYAAISLRDTAYGAFFTGPSATADIEAVRVTGAQGPISLTVLLYK